MKEIKKIEQQYKEVSQGLEDIIKNPENYSKEDIKSIREKLSAALNEIELAYIAKLKSDTSKQSPSGA